MNAPPPPKTIEWRAYLGVFRYTKRAIQLVWSTSRALTIGLALGSLFGGVLPAGVAYAGKRLVDSIIAARASSLDRHVALMWVGAELGLVVASALVQRTLGIFRQLLREQLGNRINGDILEKALTLDLTQFEDSEVYDKLTRARREASSRPLSLVTEAFELGQNLITLIGLGGLLAAFSRSR